MKDLLKILITLSLLASGVVLVPAMGLPTEGFRWQRYAGVYAPASLQTNHSVGQPGSFFTVFGSNFTPDTSVNVSANGALLGQIQTDGNGELLFLIDSAGADVGTYFVEATGAETGLALFDLSADAPLWPQEGEGVIFSLPAGIALNFVRLPMISK